MNESHNLKFDEIMHLAIAATLKGVPESELTKTCKDLIHTYRVAFERIRKIDLEENPPDNR